MMVGGRLLLALCVLCANCSAEKAAIDIDAQGQMSDTAAEAKATPEKNVEPKETTESQEPTLEAIDQELLETEDLIAGQQKKVALLQVLRREYLSGQRGGVSLSKSIAELEAASSLLSAAVPTMGATSDKNFDDYLITRSDFETPSASVVEVLTFRCRESKEKKKDTSRRRSPSTVVVILVADKTGQLHFVEATTGHTILSYSSHHKEADAYTTSVIFDTLDSRPVLIVGGSDGSIAVHKLVLYRDGQPVAGRLKAVPDPNFEEDETGKPVKQRMIAPPSPEQETESGYALAVETATVIDRHETAEDTNEKVSAVVALELYARQSRKMIISASGNNIDVFAFNGTHTRRFPTLHPVTALKRSGVTMAYSAGTGISFLQLSRMREASYACQGALSPVTSLIYDALSSSNLYAGTKSGDVFVFNTRYKTGNEKNAAPSCRMISTLRLHPAPAAGTDVPAYVASLKGYALVATPGRVVVHNTSTMASTGPRYEFEHKAEGGGNAAGPSLIRTTAAAARQTTSFVVMAPAGSVDGQPVKFVVYESLLPYTRPDFGMGGDIGWIRNIGIGAILVIVVGWQFLKSRGRGGGDYGDMGGAGGMPPGMAEAMRGMGGAGGMRGMGGMGGRD